MNFQEEGPTNPIFERIKKIEKNDQIFLKCDQTFDKGRLKKALYYRNISLKIVMRNEETKTTNY